MKSGQTWCKKNFNHTKKLKFAKFTQMSQLWGEGKKQKKIKLLMAKERCIFLYRGGQNDDFIETETFCRAYNEVD